MLGAIPLLYCIVHCIAYLVITVYYLVKYNIYVPVIPSTSSWLPPPLIFIIYIFIILYIYKYWLKPDVNIWNVFSWSESSPLPPSPTSSPPVENYLKKVKKCMDDIKNVGFYGTFSPKINISELFRIICNLIVCILLYYFIFSFVIVTD